MSGHEHLAQALAACGRDGFTGELRITGTPGGIFHLGDGHVVAVKSPGAQGPEAPLLRSGRVSGEQWAELVRESGGSRRPATALIAHGYAGAAQLRVVCAPALHDAAFALAAGRVEDCERRATAEPFAQVPRGEPPLRLLQDVIRRLTALAALPHPVHPGRERPVRAGTDNGSGPLRRELTVEVARMLDEGLLMCTGPSTPVVVRSLPDGDELRPRTPTPVEQSPSATGTDLPRRKPGSFFRLRNGRPK
ncbi:hypothetical protein QFZ22_003925 [Streptomyces canus]|uniref:MarR family transcriptional regulator n=1 Tax=Streptomyces canus TaxID=58343 RepID=A0AAW8FFL2_9ACTN|nr:MarR family transcriptional regulator [Streptomyces canus]MDQ0907940.1 hypothetical protein [Streptomyces canus]